MIYCRKETDECRFILQEENDNSRRAQSESSTETCKSIGCIFDSVSFIFRMFVMFQFVQVQKVQNFIFLFCLLLVDTGYQ